MLFGRKKPEGRTVLLLDVENGSVGSALVHVRDAEPPKLFGETRVEFKILPTRDSSSLLAAAEGAMKRAASSVSEVASRLRNAQGSDELRGIGSISRAAVFFSAPWGVSNIGAGEPDFAAHLPERAAREVSAFFGELPLSVHTAAGATLSGARFLVPREEPYLLCLVSGEMTELLLVGDGMAEGYATVPRGRHSIVRTLRTHAGASTEESLSAMRLSGGPSPYFEPLDAAAHEYAAEVARAISRLLSQTPLRIDRVYVVAYGGMGDWFARALAKSEELGALLPGGSVRALSNRHVAERIAAHAEHPDLMLMLQALFAYQHL